MKIKYECCVCKDEVYVSEVFILKKREGDFPYCSTCRRNYLGETEE